MDCFQLALLYFCLFLLLFDGEWRICYRIKLLFQYLFFQQSLALDFQVFIRIYSFCYHIWIESREANQRLQILTSFEDLEV